MDGDVAVLVHFQLLDNLGPLLLGNPGEAFQKQRIHISFIGLVKTEDGHDIFSEWLRYGRQLLRQHDKGQPLMPGGKSQAQKLRHAVFYCQGAGHLIQN